MIGSTTATNQSSQQQDNRPLQSEDKKSEEEDEDLTAYLRAAGHIEALPIAAHDVEVSIVELKVCCSAAIASRSRERQLRMGKLMLKRCFGYLHHYYLV